MFDGKTRGRTLMSLNTFWQRYSAYMLMSRLELPCNKNRSIRGDIEKHKRNCLRVYIE
jgi:hypothetical protein